MSTLLKTTPEKTMNRDEVDTRLTHMMRMDRADGIVVLTFDHPDSAANIFDAVTMAELEAHIDAIARDATVRGLVITSAKDAIFLAGADLKSLETARGGVLLDFVETGQRVFEKLAGLKIPTVAAIHGACLGGGLELALACDLRIASPDRITKIGLPETMLGILPAWGGSTRLPKLVGLPTALSLILAGKQLAAKHAKKLGVVDEITPRERLVDRAVVLLGKKLPKRKSHWLTNNPLSAAIIRRKAIAATLKKTRGNYPALEAVIEVVTSAPNRGVRDSLHAERDAVLRLSETGAARNLMRVFHLSERAKKFKYLPERDDPSSQDGPKPFSETKTSSGFPRHRRIGSEATRDRRAPFRIAVIGAGVMGAGIAQWFSARDFPVILSDLNNQAVANGLANIDKIYASAVKRRIFTTHEARLKRDKIAPIAYRVPLTSTDLVIEAAVEKLDVKKKIFVDLCKRVRSDTILATNTSALPITNLAKAEGITHPERIIGIHFFNPVHRMKLVEIVVTEFTAPEVVEATLRFVRKLGKSPVVVQDSPGFVVNRILMPYLIEAGRLFDGGVDANTMDEAMLDFGMPMGPLRLLDEVGLDVAVHVAGTMGEAFGDKFAVPMAVSRLVENGHLGRKSGAGFFDHTAKKQVVNLHALESRSTSGTMILERGEIATRLAGLMVDEARMVLDEGVAASADDIDFAMILGTGFAPFRGGPLAFGKGEK